MTKRIDGTKPDFKFNAYSFADEHSKFVDKLIKDYHRRKEEIIRKAYTDKGFLNLLEDDPTRRFKRMCMEEDDKKERYFADDGSMFGCLVLTIYKPDTTKFGSQAVLEINFKYE